MEPWIVPRDPRPPGVPICGKPIIAGQNLGASGRTIPANGSKLKPNLQFFVSDVPHKFTEVGERFLGAKLGKVQRVEGFLK